jgi:hypothetical protein
MMQRGFDDRHCWPPKTFSTFIAQRNAALKSSTNCLFVLGPNPSATGELAIELGEEGPVRGEEKVRA